MDKKTYEDLKDSLASLEYVRFALAICVVIYHGPEYGLPRIPYLGDSGFFAVLSFMVLSGVVLSFRTEVKAMTIPEFILRRFLRLYPLHASTTLIMLCLSLFLALPSNQPDVKHLLLHLTLLHGTGLEDFGTLNTPSWAVSTEFIVAVMLSLTLVQNRQVGWKFLIMTTTLVVYQWDVVDTRLIICIFSVCAGSIIFWSVKKIHERNCSIQKWLFLVTTTLALLILLSIRITANRIQISSFRYIEFIKESYFVDVAIISLAMCSLLVGVNLLGFKYMQLASLGKYAYSIYLLHTPVFITVFCFTSSIQLSMIQDVTFAICSTLGLLAACLFAHRYLEYPTRRIP